MAFKNNSSQDTLFCYKLWNILSSAKVQEAHDKTVYHYPSILRPHLLKCSLPPGKNGHFFLVDSIIPYSDSTDLFFIH